MITRRSALLAGYPHVQKGRAPAWTPGLHPKSRRRYRVALSDALVYPVLHFVGNPRDAALAQLYPLGEMACQFEARDVLERVRYTEQTFQLFLAHQFRVVHRQF